MPLFAFIGHDAARGHAGPMLDEEGCAVGSVILFEADDLGAARDIAAKDPYVTKGVFARYEIYETRVVFPR